MAKVPQFEREILPMETPKWLDILENRRKRSHRLAHEVGAGSPCLVCKEKCKGLNLHFWRKICIGCKCRKEDHDFTDEDEYAQFEILFGAKRVKKTTLKFNADNKTFDWVPQNVPQELVVNYLNALPQSKLPITNTEGAIFRRQQLEKQIPLHDVNPNACHNLTDKEVFEFGKYLENLKENVIGQGKIIKYGDFNFSKGTCSPGSSHGKPCFMKRENMHPHCTGILGHLVCVNEPLGKTVYSGKVNTESYCAKSKLLIDLVKHDEMRSEDLKNCYDSGEELTSNSKMAGNSYDIMMPDVFCEMSEKLQDLTVEIQSPAAKLPALIGYDVERDTINGNVNKEPCTEIDTQTSFLEGGTPVYDSENNKAVRHSNDKNSNEYLAKSGTDVTTAPAVSLLHSNNINSLKSFSNVHDNAAFSHKELSNVNIMNASSVEVPFIPIEESQSISKGKELSEKYMQVELKELAESREKLEKSEQKCIQCEGTFTTDDVVVRTDRAGDSSLWHARCFVCDICQELLVDLMYFFHDGKVYCGRDYAKVRDIPRCFACDELIFLKEYTRAEGKSYHVKHFCCFHCDEPLGGKQYIQKDNQPVCLECYQNHYGKTCHTCSSSISVEEQRISMGELHFHVVPKCFRCENCFRSLIGERFVIKNEKTFCSKQCYLQYQEQF